MIYTKVVFYTSDGQVKVVWFDPGRRRRSFWGCVKKDFSVKIHQISTALLTDLVILAIIN